MRPFTDLRTAVLLGLTLLPFSGCGDHGGVDGSELVTVTGFATLPPGVSNTKSSAANSVFQVVDFSRAPTQQVIATGVTDGNGGFSVDVPPTRVMAVIVSDLVRVSGLVSADPNERDSVLFEKNFDGITDIACEAGATAISDGSVPASDFDDRRIANLEAGAQLLTDQVNYFDPASVTAAAAEVRRITDDGDHPPR